MVGESCDINGFRAFMSPGIATMLCPFYKDLYSNKISYQDTALQHFMSFIMLPALSEDDQDLLDSPITLEELQTAFSIIPNSKALGADGLSGEIYKSFGKDILIELLAFEISKLPQSMNRL